MSRTSVVLMAVIGGFIGGIVLSQIIGVIGFLTLDQPVGLRGLPVILAIVAAGIALYWTRLPDRSVRGRLVSQAQQRAKLAIP